MQTNNKLREAVKEARRFVFAAAQGQRDLLVRNGVDEPYVLKPKDTLAKMDAALAEPVKNCEVGTAEEQLERLNAYCKKCDGCMSYTRPELLDEVCLCALKWAQKPYKEGGGK